MLTERNVLFVVQEKVAKFKPISTSYYLTH